VLWAGCQWKAIHRSWFGVCSSVIHERFQTWRKAGIFDQVLFEMVQFYAEHLGIGWAWQSIDNGIRPAPLGCTQTCKNPTDRGKMAAKSTFWWMKTVSLCRSISLVQMNTTSGLPMTY
jgi:transposase